VARSQWAQTHPASLLWRARCPNSTCLETANIHPAPPGHASALNNTRFVQLPCRSRQLPEHDPADWHLEVSNTRNWTAWSPHTSADMAAQTPSIGCQDVVPGCGPACIQGVARNGGRACAAIIRCRHLPSSRHTLPLTHCSPQAGGAPATCQLCLPPSPAVMRRTQSKHCMQICMHMHRHSNHSCAGSSMPSAERCPLDAITSPSTRAHESPHKTSCEQQQPPAVQDPHLNRAPEGPVTDKCTDGYTRLCSWSTQRCACTGTSKWTPVPGSNHVVVL
jgi:hypothetical protein